MAVVTVTDAVAYRIGTLSGFFLLGGAFFLDAVGFLLMLTVIGEVATEIIGIVGTVGSFILFTFFRVNFLSGRSTQKVGIVALGSIVEIIPFLNGISPTFTIETAGIIHTTRKEDEEKAKKTREAANNNEGARQRVA